MSAIIRIISVVDTRQYDEQGDRFVPIPGSGNVRSCDRCGRDHEVHATVELDDGATAIVGTGCMTAASTEVASALKSATSAAKRLAQLRAERSALASLVSERERIAAEVRLLPRPEVTESCYQGPYDQEPKRRLHMGESWILAPQWESRDYQLRSLEGTWRLDQEQARGRAYKHDHAFSALPVIEDLISKTEKRLAALCK